MEITATRAEPPFTPVTATITFSTQDELRAFCALFNSSLVTAALRDVYGADLGGQASELWSIHRLVGMDSLDINPAFLQNALRKRLG